MHSAQSQLKTFLQRRQLHERLSNLSSLNTLAPQVHSARLFRQLQVTRDFLIDDAWASPSVQQEIQLVNGCLSTASSEQRTGSYFAGNLAK
jgi:hypothetical protein